MAGVQVELSSAILAVVVLTSSPCLLATAFLPGTTTPGVSPTSTDGGPASWLTRELPDGFVVRTRTVGVGTSELRPIVDLEGAVALDGEANWPERGRMSDFYSVGPALATRLRTTPITFVAFGVTLLAAVTPSEPAADLAPRSP